MKKITKSILGLSMIATFIAMVMFSAGCEGPQGPAGQDGLSGNGTCTTCHSDEATDVNLKFAQYDLSKHNTGVVYIDEAGRIACGGCHSGDGFAEAATLGQNAPVSKATSKINCKACHTIHKDYAQSDFGLRISSGHALYIGGATIDLGKGNLCAKCHQGRAFTRTTPDTISPAGSASYSRLGPHYGTPTNVFTMNGPIQVPGSTAYPTSNPHLSLADGCVSCHMGTDAANPGVGGHTFLMPVANLSTITACQTCHDATQIKSGTVTKQVAKDIAEYRRILIDKGWLDTAQAVTEHGYIVLGEYFATPGGKKRADLSKTDVDVVLNYLYVAKDRSNGVHNPSYVKALVANGLEYLKQ